MRKAGWGGYKWLLPLLGLLVLIELVPWLYMIRSSFLAWSYTDMAKNGQFIGWDNYRTILNYDPHAGHSLIITCKYLLGALPLQFGIGLLIALLLTYHPLLKKCLLPFIIIPIVLAGAVVGLIARLLLNADFGPVGIFLESIGLVKGGILGHPDYALGGVILADVWQWSPFLVIIFLAGMTAAPTDCYEAAIVDGASEWQKFVYLTLPFLKPYFAVGFLLRFTDAFRMFDKVWLMTKGGPSDVTELLNIHAYRVFFRAWDLGYGAALAFLIFALAFIMCLIFVKLTFRTER
jgi:multiple sugar transport system permease protein